MAILVNMGKRGFILKEGSLAPGQQIVVDEESANKLSRMYPNELKLIEMPKEVKVKPQVEEVKHEPEEIKTPVKQTPKRGRPKKEVKAEEA